MMQVKHDFLHVPVMLQEMLGYLNPTSSKHYLDCTLGFGSFSKAILDTGNCMVTALDRDPEVIHYANNLSNKYKTRFNFFHTDFLSYVKSNLVLDIKFDGIVMDLGISNMQVSNPLRGFSFKKSGPLDMRMSCEGLTAEEFINTATEDCISDIIFQFGEEHFANKIAKNIVLERSIRKISFTSDLADIVRKTKKINTKIDPATKTFQAIRIFINDELNQLIGFLNNVRTILNENGVIIVISFHSLEDRIVKIFFKNNSLIKISKSKYSTCLSTIDKSWLKILTKKPISPSIEEKKNNKKSRSAKLRAAVKIKL